MKKTMTNEEKAMAEIKAHRNYIEMEHDEKGFIIKRGGVVTDAPATTSDLFNSIYNIFDSFDKERSAAEKYENIQD
jgi:hypothetical protein